MGALRVTKNYLRMTRGSLRHGWLLMVFMMLTIITIFKAVVWLFGDTTAEELTGLSDGGGIFTKILNYPYNNIFGLALDFTGIYIIIDSAERKYKGSLFSYKDNKFMLSYYNLF